MIPAIVRPPRLRPGDHVRLVSPASTPAPEAVEGTSRFLEGLGLRVTVGEHALDRLGYLAGTDEDRLADLNAALRDPGITAVIATKGGKGAYRIAGDLDFAAAARHPKLLVGFSEITVLHLALWQRTGVAGLHGAPFEVSWAGERAAQSFLTAAFTTDDITVTASADEPTSALTTSGRVSGVLLGGNQDMVATAAGWALPDLTGAILLLEAYNLRLGHIDRQLTMLERSGRLEGVRGIAVGQYTECGPTPDEQLDWTAVDVLRDRLGRLGVPILGGLPIGHGSDPVAVPVGTPAVLDAGAGTLTVSAAVV
ncbi:S66 peptidase family protein [Actinoplanes friuliensis]|uniref:Peptidase U61, LD-carboxypeptidase A n=1 Tax=Actinoplanes friuliensis DSM 7358 TaxID=1246995 RepID=U5VXV8_9ACTN|nr:LD-carboxypeptidase [Actinoplanes friuliensis]AGZ41828.1 peptidase U61, LD-carboxypeptidase A [Actinoplanes friuliensis DSM 7358]